MSFHYTKHIRKRIRQRGLTAAMIEQTVTAPHRTYTTYKNRHLAQRKFRDKLLEVIFKQEGEQIILITAYWIKESER